MAADNPDSVKWEYPAIVKMAAPAMDSPKHSQTLGMILTAVAEDIAASTGLLRDSIDPDDTALHLDTCVGDLAMMVGRCARRLGWIEEATDPVDVEAAVDGR